MPKFLNERQIGVDPAKVGFPNLGDCMGLVLLDEGGLFGFHLTRGDLDNAAKFVEYVQNHRLYTGRLVGLYSVCNFKRRYGQGGGKNDWKAELRGIAQAAGYQGTVNGYDLGNTGIKAPEAIHAEFRLAGSACTLWYKRMSKMSDTSGAMEAPDDDIRELAPDMAARKALYDLGRGHEWDNNKPLRTASTRLGRGSTVDMQLKNVTKGNKGELHQAKSLLDFDV